MLWARGVSSPCFRHDHHIISRNGTPPVSAGNWETDWRQIIEVQFDQFGVASDCRSTWGRTGPWRANRYRYTIVEAYSKLQLEIIMLLSRLGAHLSGSYNVEVSGFGDIYMLWRSVYGYENPRGNFGYDQPAGPLDWPLCSGHNISQP